MRVISLSVALAALAIAPASAQVEPLDYDIINKIMDEGFNRSEVMNTLTHLADDIGPRLTNSPGMREAAAWSRDRFRAYGLQNAALELFPFGPGWSYDRVVVHMTAPRRTQIQAMPIAWHPGTDGIIEGEAILAAIEDEDGFEQFRGKLGGKIVMISKERERDEPSEPIFTRLDAKDLAGREEFPIPDAPSMGPEGFEKVIAFREKLVRFLESEGAAGLVMASRKEAGLLAAEGYTRRADNLPKIPGLTVASEDYDRMARLISRGETVRLSFEIEAEFHTDNLEAQNVIAEIPGRGSRPEIVMAGAHLDSWFMADGAVDNAAGSAIVLEAARILAALGVSPKRTIRFALWDAEELGLYGSIYHVEKHFGSKPEIEDAERRNIPKFFWMNEVWPVRKGRDYELLSGYFNLDNGSGRIRGINGNGNTALQPVFERWFEPFHELGAKTVVLRNSGGSDHLPFQTMGLPGFAFIQDPLDYSTRLHHSDIDTASHVYEKDLQQAAVILASFLWHAAEREERLARLPTPTRPNYPADKED